MLHFLTQRRTEQPNRLFINLRSESIKRYSGKNKTENCIRIIHCVRIIIFFNKPINVSLKIFTPKTVNLTFSINIIEYMKTVQFISKVQAYYLL